MAVGRATGSRDDSPRLPPLSLGLSSVRFIVNKLEVEYARVTAPDTFETGRELVKYDPNIDEGYDEYDDSPLGNPSGKVWSRFAANLGFALSRCIPSVTFGNFGLLALTTGLFAPRMITYLVLYPFCRLVFGTLYPAYASYKAVRTKNLKEYVKWMMYWIVFALFTCTETFTDVFLSWFPFYYEVKIVLVLWLLSPATKGSSILYRKFVHPALCRREQEIDEYIAKAKDQGYHTVLNLGTKGVNYATTVIMQTAIKGGGGLVQQLRKSYSLSDLTECEPREERGSDEADDVMTEPRIIRRGTKTGYTTRRSASESNSRSPMYFPEVDVDVRPRPRSDEPDFSHIKSTEDISSGYSSADNSASLTRTASLGAGARRGRSTRTSVTPIKRPQAAEESAVIIEELQDDDSYEYTNMPPLFNLPSPVFLSHTQPPFIYQYVGDQVKILQVLDYPLNASSNNQTDNNTDLWDQREVATEEVSTNRSVDKENEETVDVSKNVQDNIINTDIVPDNSVTNQDKDNNGHSTTSNDIIHEIVPTTPPNESGNSDANKEDIKDSDEQIETMSYDVLLDANESAESDDEASFGTPENSPKSKRKSPRGKYGKGKAPPPPKLDADGVFNVSENKLESNTLLENMALQENLVDIVKNLPNTSLHGTGLSKSLQVVNPIAEHKRRHKSKSPARISKSNSSGLGKLLQLPSKLVFWHRNEDNKPKTEETSTSSDNHSRRSSTIERVDDFQDCSEINAICTEDSKIDSDTINTEDQISFKDASDLDTEVTTQEIFDKSDALQKLIEAKIESHPEYKFISLHEETPTSAKTTDV